MIIFMSDTQNKLNEALNSAKEGLRKGALIATEKGLEFLTPERAESIDSVDLASKLRNGLAHGAEKLRKDGLDDKAEPKA